MNQRITYSATHSPRPIAESFTFSAKERDSETGLSYFGSRYYSSDLSVWLSVDPMSDKYASLSPYVYCADNPVLFKDPNGDSVAVLLAESSPIVGHMAILVQIHGGKNDGKWALWSKNGENKTWSHSAVNLSDDKGVRVWNSPQEFLNMNDEEYEDAYVIPTTREQDKQITEGFRKSQDINYNFLKANCSIAVQSGLKAGGLKDGSLSRLEKNILKFAPIGNVNKLYIELSPVHIFSRIRNQNPNGIWLKRQ
jgi:RHS repeat-associated protein